MKNIFYNNLLLWSILLNLIIINTMNSESIKKRDAFIPPNGKILFFVGQDIDTIDTYIKETKRIPAGFMIYTSLQKLEGLDTLVNFGAGDAHAQHLIDKYPNTVLQIGLYLVNHLESINTEKADQNITQLGEWIKETKRPVYLRIGYEFDFPQNNYDPDQYIKAYQYIVRNFQKNNVNNVAYVWHSFASHSNKPVMKWYPGDEYVDWIGISFFSLPNIANMNLIARIAKKHKKPLMIGEATPHGIGTGDGKGSWKKWFIPFFKFINRQKVTAVSYINTNWEDQPMWQGQGWGDARIQADEYVKQKWLKEINKDKYLHSSPELFKLLGYTLEKK